ncbi:MAG: hypothetical protein ACR2GZ_05965 [Solirubrobacteraceae bacterium]
MLDPRIYRTGLVLVAMAVLVLAFSLQNQPGAVSSTLAPDAFNGQNVFNAMVAMAGPNGVQDRRPGSEGDKSLASSVAISFERYGFAVTRDVFTGRTADGTRTLENVVAVRPGTQSGSIVVIAHRDARASPPAVASLSGTATLVELARDLEGETLHRTVVLASTTGAQGTAGALRLAATLGGPVDAVLALGDLAGGHQRQPIVVPWSTSPDVAPPRLRNTIAAELNQQATLPVGGTSLFGQFLHLAFPLTVSEQAPFGSLGVPAVLISLSGERGPAPSDPLSGVDALNATGRSVLATISALDSAPTLPAASAYVLLDNKVVPGWAISVFVLALIVPVLLTTIDGLARARRRGHAVWRWLVLTLLAAVPFALAVLVVLAARLLGALPVAPAAPTPAGAVPIASGGIAVLVVAALVALGSGLLVRPLAVGFARPRARSRAPGRDSAIEGAVVGLLAVACLVTFALWTANPFAAALVLPGLHLWLVALSPDLRLRFALRLGLLLVGLVPLALVPVYYAATLGYSPGDGLWMLTLLIAGHGVGLAATVEWSVFAGCVLTAAAVLVALARQPRPEEAPVTVRGPVGYAGPGSLGGTESALRR